MTERILGPKGPKRKLRMKLIPLLLLLSAILLIGATQATGAFGPTVIDESGPNDVPGQKDLNSQAVDDSGLPNTLLTRWNWDELTVSGANTLDACSLLDSDGDGLANFAICGTTNGALTGSATVTTTLYSCGDTRADRCSSQIAVITPTFGSTCTAVVSASDPFPGPAAKLKGASYPNDLQATCTIQLDDFGVNVNTLELINTCSYPSQQPNSDPSDCVLVPRDATLKIIKDAGDDDSTVFSFDVRVNTTGSNTLVQKTITGSGETTVPIVGGRPNSIAEVSIPTGWTFSTASCTGSTTTPVLTGSTLTNVTAATGTTVTCTFVDIQPKAEPSAATAPSVIPQDTVTLSGVDATGTGGDLHIELWTAAGCTGTQVYDQDFTGATDGVYTTTNDGVVLNGGYTITADGTFYWKVIYDGDDRNEAFTDCNETVQVDLTASP